MKRIVLFIFALFAFIGAGSLYAQDLVQVTIPFDFHVGKTAMPAGTYNIGPCAQNVMLVRHCTSGVAAMQIANPSGDQAQEHGSLIFNKYGEKYFLNEVKGLPISGDLKLTVSAFEKKVQDEYATVRTYEKVTLPEPPEQQLPK